MNANSYRVSTCDPVDDETQFRCGWRVRSAGVSRWGLRHVIRDLLGQGYDVDVSILVELEDNHSGERREGEK